MASTYIPNTNNVTISTTGSNYSYGAGATVGGTITLNSGAGSSGQIYTTTGSNGASWVTPNTTFNNGHGNTLMSIPYGEDKIVLDERATLDVKGNVKINGVDLEERLKTIETLLHIPTRDVTMETKHPKLKQIYEQYMHELEKYKTWDRIKGKDE